MKKTAKPYNKTLKMAHKWTWDWPGNICKVCGMADPVEAAFVNGWFDFEKETWDTKAHERYVLSCLECPGDEE